MPPGSTSPQIQDIALEFGKPAAALALSCEEGLGLIPQVLDRELAADQVHPEAVLVPEGIPDVPGLPAVIVPVEIGDHHGKLCPARRYAATPPGPKAAPDPLRVQRLLQRLAKPNTNDRAHRRDDSQQQALDRPIGHAGALYDEKSAMRAHSAPIAPRLQPPRAGGDAPNTFGAIGERWTVPDGSGCATFAPGVRLIAASALSQFSRSRQPGSIGFFGHNLLSSPEISPLEAMHQVD